MASLGVTLFLISFLGGLFYWAAVLRPYLQRKGITQITGPNWGMSALSDWQMCCDHAREQRDDDSRRVARGYIFLLFGQLAGIGLFVAGCLFNLS